MIKKILNIKVKISYPLILNIIFDSLISFYIISLLLKDIQESRKQMKLNNTTLSSLKHTELDFPFSLMVFKTMHIPMVLHKYQSHLQIHSRFKTIHLEYLIDRDINTIEDIRKLADSL